MIPWTTVLYSGISAFLAFLLPLGLAFWFWRKTKVPITTVLIGALTFFVMQVVLRIPLLQVVTPDPETLNDWISTTRGFWLYSGFLALTAALFEELGRFLFFKLFRRRADWQNAVGLGIGHGGAEAILIVGIGAIANTIILAVLAAELPVELPAQLVQQFTSTPPLDFLAGGIERLLTIPIHIALSTLVVAGIANKRFRYVVLAIAAHFLLNFPLAWLAQNFGIWPTEGYVLLWSIAAWAMIFRSQRLFETSTP